MPAHRAKGVVTSPLLRDHGTNLQTHPKEAMRGRLALKRGAVPRKRSQSARPASQLQPFQERCDFAAAELGAVCRVSFAGALGMPLPTPRGRKGSRTRAGADALGSGGRQKRR